MGFQKVRPIEVQNILSNLPEIDNICVFMADALRWDYLPDTVAEQGLTFKTVAASLTTHTSLPSMITGLWPKRHGVLSWQHQIPEVPHLLDMDGINDGYYMPGDGDVTDDGTFSVLRRDERLSLSELLTPWTYFERHHGGHAPFNAAGWEGTWEDFLTEFAGDSRKHRIWYQKAIDGTVEDFQDRLDTIAEKGEEEDTLVIFTSDHGEYLGESGLVDHNSPIRPETVYVPTTFIHPQIPGNIHADHVMRHVDLFPTVLDILNRPTLNHIDGDSILRTSPERGYSLSISNIRPLGKPIRIFEAASLWDYNGGWVRNDSSIFRRIAMGLGLVIGSRWKARHMRKSVHKYPSAVGHYLRSSKQFGSPNFSWTKANEDINQIESLPAIGDNQTIHLSEDTEQRLRELGYL